MQFDAKQEIGNPDYDPNKKLFEPTRIDHKSQRRFEYLFESKRVRKHYGVEGKIDPNNSSLAKSDKESLVVGACVGVVDSLFVDMEYACLFGIGGAGVSKMGAVIGTYLAIKKHCK